MKSVRALKILALFPPAITLAIQLLFGIGETVGGDWSGLGHLITAIPIGLVMWLGWKRPFWAGLLFLVLGLLFVAMLLNVLRSPDGTAPLLLIITPLLLAGLLLVGASQLEQKAA